MGNKLNKKTKRLKARQSKWDADKNKESGRKPGSLNGRK